MKALVYHGPGNKAWEDVPDPVVQDPTDIIVKIETTTICGTDLHILKGDVPAVTDGRILGHEAVGTIVEVGPGIKNFKVGQRVLVPAVTCCGMCIYCRAGHPSHCQAVGGIGWIFGHLIDGTQAEFVRVPFGDTSLHLVPDGVRDDQVIFLADIIPTGYEMGVKAGAVKPGDVVVCIGAGPVGLAAMMTSHLHGPQKVIAVDLDDFRLEQAKKHYGATHSINSGDADWKDQVRALTDGLGVDVVFEAVGIPATIEAAFDIVRPYGHVANIGVHGKPITLPIDRLWIENITLTMGLVDGFEVPMLLRLVADGMLDVEAMATHRFTFDEFDKAYEVFGNAASNDAIKVLIER